MFLFSSLISPLKAKVVKTFDPVRKADKLLFVERTKDPNEGLLFSDFSIRSLLDAQAVDLLQPLSPLSASRLAALDSSSAAVSSLSGLVDSLPVESSSETNK